MTHYERLDWCVWMLLRSDVITLTKAAKILGVSVAHMRTTANAWEKDPPPDPETDYKAELMRIVGRRW